MKINNTIKSLLALFTFALCYCLMWLAFISLADGESSTIPGYILNLVNCPKTWRSLSKFLLCCIILVPSIWIISGKQNIFKAWGLSEGIIKALIFGVVCSAPMLLCGIIFGQLFLHSDIFIKLIVYCRVCLCLG